MSGDLVIGDDGEVVLVRGLPRQKSRQPRRRAPQNRSKPRATSSSKSNLAMCGRKEGGLARALLQLAIDTTHFWGA
jgi:hypothetical protein